MSVRTRRHKVTFNKPFLLKAAGRTLPAGIYRRVATIMIVPAPAPSSATEMLTVDPSDLTAALERDGSAGLGAAPRAR